MPLTLDINTREASRFPVPGLQALAALGMVPFQFRVGTGPDTDVGVRWLGLGFGLDVRHRFFQHGRLHVATIPSLNASVNPTGDLTTLMFDTSVPLVIEGELGHNLAIIGDLRLTLRNELVGVGGQWLPRLAVLPGVGARLEWNPKTFRLGVSAAWVPQSGRGGAHGVSASLDFGGRVPTRKTRRANKAREQAASSP